jgi:predicted  nucleic acid-binding Zn-ribbon protein
MSLAAQINDLENELEHYQSENSRLNTDLYTADCRIADLEYDCNEMGKFIEYVDATNPELRVAYEASKILKGDKP